MRFAVLRPNGRYTPRDYAQLRSVRGEPMAEVPVAPTLLVEMVARELRASARQPVAEVLTAIERAAEIFAASSIAGQTSAEYAAAVNHSSGLPVAVIEGAASELRQAMQAIRSIIEVQTPRGVSGFGEHRSSTSEAGGPGVGAEFAASTRWIPRGSVLGVIAPSNHPGTHVSWLQALALGYKVIVRPGSRDPFTPYRLALALIEAGLDPSMVAFLPGDHQTAARIVESSDCALVFGGEGSLRHLQGRTPIIARGPGYSKVVAARDSALTADAVAASLVRSASGDAGVKCTNASGFISDRGDFDAVRDAVVARMAAIPARPLGDREAALPLFPIDQARRLRAALSALVERSSLSELGAGAHDAVVDFGDGSGTLAPAALACAAVTPDVLNIELPFPALWLARVSDVSDVADFGGTLVMGYMGSDERLCQRLVDDPRIGKVIRGTLPTYRSYPLVPHDGFLAHALMVAKASIHTL
ncbi:aldehyde dehydrogenase family protein [Sorangium sp. So ce429]